MATYTKDKDHGAERHGVRAVRTPERPAERMASLWMKTAAGLEKIWEGIRSCFGSGRWRYGRPWLYKERWRYSEETRKHLKENGLD